MSARRRWNARKVDENDRARIVEAIAADAFHAGKSEAGFWVDTTPGSECFAVEDAQGVVLYAKCENVMRVHLQAAEGVSPVRAAAAIVAGFGWLKQKARERSYREMIFSSVAPAMMKLCARIGFRETRDDFTVQL